MSVLREARESTPYKKYAKILATAQGRLDLGAFRSEALSLHSSRTSRTLYGKKQYSAQAVYDALLRDLSFRSRLVEIRVKVSVELSNLIEATKSIRRYLMTEFAEDLREFSTADQRKSFVDRIIKPGLDYEAEAQSIVDLVDLIIRDIDQAGFSFRNIVETLKLMDGSKGARTV